MSALQTTPSTPAQLTEWCTAVASELREAQKRGADLDKRIETAITTSTKALEVIEDRKLNAIKRDVSGTDADLRRYVKDDGRVQLRTETRTLKLSDGRVQEYEAPGLLDDVDAASPWHLDLQRAIGARCLARMTLRAGTSTPRLDGEVARIVARAPMGLGDAVVKSFVDSTGVGAEWIPDVFSPDLWMAFELPTMLEDMLETMNITGGSTLRPKITQQGRPYLIGAEADLDEPSKLPVTVISTDQQALTCPTFGMRFLIGYAAAEDSALMVQSIVANNLVKSLRDGYEDCMINGDTTATHQDTISGWNIRSRWGTANLGGTNDHRRAFIGWRALAEDRSASVNQASGMTVAKIMEELIGGMNEYAAGDLAIVTSPEVYFKKLVTDTNLLTVDKAGPAATILRGQVANIAGRPVVLSRYVDYKYNTSGIYDNSTKTKSGVLVVDRSAFQHYQKRGPTTEITRIANTQRIELVCTRRKGMDTLTGSTEKVVMWGYGWTGVS